jgi:hypothetical protein
MNEFPLFSFPFLRIVFISWCSLFINKFTFILFRDGINQILVGIGRSPIVALVQFSSRYMVYGIWYMVYGTWYMVYGIWYMVHGIWYMVHGIWYMVYGTWYMVHGIWYMVYGIWYTYYTLL